MDRHLLAELVVELAGRRGLGARIALAQLIARYSPATPKEWN